MAKKKIDDNTRICSSCIEEFKKKDIYSASVPNKDYSTLYCIDCIDKMGITEYEPYIKKRESKKK